MSEQGRTIEDGFGGFYQKCDDPQCELEVVRPGKTQCNKCSDREGRYVLDTRTNTCGFLDMDTMVSVIEQQVEKIDTLESDLAATKRECEGLREVVERLPKTADGFPVAENMGVFFYYDLLEQVCETGVFIDSGGWNTRACVPISECYSTSEATLAARDATEGG